MPSAASHSTYVSPSSAYSIVDWSMKGVTRAKSISPSSKMYSASSNEMGPCGRAVASTECRPKHEYAAFPPSAVTPGNAARIAWPHVAQPILQSSSVSQNAPR